MRKMRRYINFKNQWRNWTKEEITKLRNEFIKGTSYRLDPEEAVRVLQIKPDEEYKTQQSRPVTQPDKPKIVYRGR